MPAKLNTICYVHNIAEHLTQEINNISSRMWNTLLQHHSQFILHPTIDTLLPISLDLKKTAQQINTSICNMLPVLPNNFLLSQASDFINSEQWDPTQSRHMFKSKTNLTSFVCLQPGA
ncbi:unnamed protein product [Rhizophagus irregularis]|nr:unnamed protein product [Rhizophagus irregularis]